MWDKLKCLVGRHDLRHIQHLAGPFDLVGCLRCRTRWVHSPDDVGVYTGEVFSQQLQDLYSSYGIRLAPWPPEGE